MEVAPTHVLQGRRRLALFSALDLREHLIAAQLSMATSDMHIHTLASAPSRKIITACLGAKIKCKQRKHTDMDYHWILAAHHHIETANAQRTNSKSLPSLGR